MRYRQKLTVSLLSALLATVSVLHSGNSYAVPAEYNTVCSLENVSPQPSPYHGVTYYKLNEVHHHGKTDSSACSTDNITHPVHIIKVDLKAVGIEPLVRPQSNNNISTFDWVTNNDINVAMNTGFGSNSSEYMKMSSCASIGRAAIGYQKSEGVEYSCYSDQKDFPVVGFDIDNNFLYITPDQMGSDIEKTIKEKMYNAFSSYVFTLLKDGKIAENNYNANSWIDTNTVAKVKSLATTPHPRSSVGIDKSGRYLYMVIVDGRRKDMTGMSIEELGYCFKNMGAYHAFNLDGGGSSSMSMENLMMNSSCQGCSDSYAQCKNVTCVSTSLRPQYVLLGIRSLVKNAIEYIPQKTDIDGDGKSDICMRGKNGLMCVFSSDSDKKYKKVLDLGDESGWADVSNYASLYFADINGDDKADLCARTNKGIQCWISQGTSFSSGSPIIEMPDSPKFDQPGYNNVKYYSTIRAADIDGDGRDEICARFIDGFKCFAWDDKAWSAPIELGDMGDSVSWGSHEYYSTIRMADVNGDGKADVCGRGKKGFRCWISSGSGFDKGFVLAPWSNENGWNNPEYYETIRMADINGDGKMDVCARDKEGIVCYQSDGADQGKEVRGPALPDSSGWADFDNNSTLRFADINGDKKDDICIRANAGLKCYLAVDSGFEQNPYTIADMSNEHGWNKPERFMTIRTGDINGDNRQEICARDATGIVCYAFTGKAFVRMDGVVGADSESWSDENGWNRPQYYTTMRLGGTSPHACIPAEEICDGVDNNCDGQIDEDGVCDNTPETPVDPVDPETPVDPVDPETPVDPVDPETPVDPVDPETPVDPVDPETPVDPVDPETPADPVDPETPADPVDPAHPGAGAGADGGCSSTPNVPCSMPFGMLFGIGGCVGLLFGRRRREQKRG